jgi:hypothetical protein
MDGPGLEMLARCVQSNVDQATSVHDSIVAGLEAEVERLTDLLNEASMREWRAETRIRWLMGYDEEV